jgi:hypothetical protein
MRFTLPLIFPISGLSRASSIRPWNIFPLLVLYASATLVLIPISERLATLRNLPPYDPGGPNWAWLHVALFTINTRRPGNSGLIQHEGFYFYLLTGILGSIVSGTVGATGCG